VKLFRVQGRLTDQSLIQATTREPREMPKLDYDVCARCGQLFDDQGENGWWIREGLWWHQCDAKRPARIVVRKLELNKSETAAA
jgi:hypothetical protein